MSIPFIQRMMNGGNKTCVNVDGPKFQRDFFSEVCPISGKLT